MKQITLYTNPLLERILNTTDSQSIAFVTQNQQHLSHTIIAESKVMAANLAEKGMLPGDKVILAIQPGNAFVVTILALMMNQAKVALIDPHMGRANYQAKLEQFQPQWAFLDYRLLLLQEHPIIRFFYKRRNPEGIYIPYKKGMKVIGVGKWLPIVQRHIAWTALLQEREVPHLKSVDDFEFMVTYTSGTLKEPKGVIHTIKSLDASIGQLLNLIEGKQSIATHLPHFMLLGIFSGHTVYVWNENDDAVQRLAFIKEHKISMLFGPPAEYNVLIDHCTKHQLTLPNELQTIIIGSAPVHKPFLKKLIQFLPSHTRVTCFYGMTENLVVSTVDGRMKVKADCSGDLLGKPVSGVKCQISPDGEILVHSDQLYKRYLHKQKRDDFHPSGDLGLLDSEGNIILTGRKKDMIIRKNFNIYPALYEPTIKEIPNVEEAVLIGTYSDKIDDEYVTLFIESKQTYSAEKIMEYLTRGKYAIDREALPDLVRFISIPRKGRQQKIDRSILRRQYTKVS